MSGTERRAQRPGGWWEGVGGSEDRGDAAMVMGEAIIPVGRCHSVPGRVLDDCLSPLPRPSPILSKAGIMGEETMDFLKDVVASAPDLAPEEDEAAAAKPKRRRQVLPLLQFSLALLEFHDLVVLVRRSGS